VAEAPRRERQHGSAGGDHHSWMRSQRTAIAARGKADDVRPIAVRMFRRRPIKPPDD
jgi:hypothetical protein